MIGTLVTGKDESVSITVQAKARENRRAGVYEALFHEQQNGIVRDYLRFSIQRAMESAESYRNAANMVSDESRDLLNYMAGQKNRQALTLKMHDPEEGPSALLARTSDRSRSVSNYLLDIDFKTLDSLDDVFLFIFKNEQKNIDMYNRLVQLERDHEVRALFLYLIKLQTADIFRLESQFSKLSKKKESVGDEADALIQAAMGPRTHEYMM